jgi:Na+/H+ antiporter NhaA
MTWARRPAGPVRDFLSTETGGAAVLLGATVAALAWANAPWSDSYESLWTTPLTVRLASTGITMDLRHWIDEGLMTLFFLVAGLEARREVDVGQMRERRRLALPAVAALGGMVVPVLVYLAFNAGGRGAHGWGAAMSTDTAFALGILALVAPSGTRLRVRLLTLAVVDDVVALVIIATAYTEHVSLAPLAVAAALYAALLARGRMPIAWPEETAALVGIALWGALLKSGIDPVVAGLAVGFVISAHPPGRTDLEQATQLTRSFREQPTPARARSARRGLSLAISPNERLQHRLHRWTSFLIVPLFALANAGVHLDGELLGRAVSSPVTLGIVVGFVVGKPLGIVGAAWLASRTWPGGLPRGLSWPEIAGGGAVAAVGFTVSLLIASLAFHGPQLEEAKLGVLLAAVLATLSGWATFRIIGRLPTAVRARQLSGTAPELVDLSEEVDPERDHVRGPIDASVTLVEYGDYQCPYCGQAEIVVRELLESFGGGLRYVWRHLPLNDVHPEAQLAAEAAQAAAAQGAFWPMHDTLLQHQHELAPSDLRRYADELGLDAERLWDELRRRTHAEHVAEDIASADASGVAGTPSLFINGRRHDGAFDVLTLTAAVRAARTVPGHTQAA